MNEIKKKNTLTIRDLETLKVLADPLRTQIIDLLQTRPLTVKEIANKLGLAPGKLYYHINLLEKHGLIQVLETHQVANMIEKLYGSTADQLEIDPSMLLSTTMEGQENILELLRSTLDATREDILRSMQARFFELDQGAQPHPRKAIIDRNISRISEEKVDEFIEQVTALVKAFTTANTQGEESQADVHPYALTIAFYPSFYYREEDENA